MGAGRDPGQCRLAGTAALYADASLKPEREALVPFGRVAGPDDIADVIAFLLGPDARYMTGQNLLVDGGLTDSLLDRVPGRTSSP